MDALLSPRRRALLQAGGAAALLAACGDARRALGGPGVHAFGGFAMGSTWTAKLVAPRIDDARLSAARDAVADALEGVVAKMSAYDVRSELSRFNRHGARTPFPLSADTLRVLGIARGVSEASDGAFDVTVAPAVDTWGFGPDKHAYVPPEATQRAARVTIGYRRLSLDATSASKADARIAIDLSGIAKGYGVDAAASALEALGFDRYMIEAGGEVRTRGRNGDGRAWQIAIERPDATPRRAHAIVPLDTGSMATSGDYRIFFEQGGRRYCHEIDPATGAPTAHALASVSVVARDCASADAWATALYVLGPERGYALAAARGLAACFIVRDGSRFEDRSTPAFATLGARAVA